MLENTFCHMPGIGPKTEAHLWRAGVLCWQDACDCPALPLPPRQADAVARHADESLRHLADGNARHFADRLASNLHWRIFPEFRHSVAYLDIETTGLAPPGDYITAVSIYDGDSIRWYVRDENLEQFCDDIRDYSLIVTYNGKTFDVPFIEDYFGIRMDQAHVDLRYVLHSLGYKGGLKGCERQLGLSRGELEGVDGYFAVLLWRDYVRNGNPKALETLLAYNMTDVVNLETLMVLAYNMKVKGTVFGETRRLALPSRPDLPFQPDMRTVRRLQREMGWI